MLFQLAAIEQKQKLLMQLSLMTFSLKELPKNMCFNQLFTITFFLHLLFFFLCKEHRAISKSIKYGNCKIHWVDIKYCCGPNNTDVLSPFTMLCA